VGLAAPRLSGSAAACSSFRAVAMERPPYARYAAGRGVGQPLQNYKRSLDRIVTLVIAVPGSTRLARCRSLEK
jgi:hypothetical protein